MPRHLIPVVGELEDQRLLLLVGLEQILGRLAVIFRINNGIGFRIGTEQEISLRKKENAANSKKTKNFCCIFCGVVV